MIEVNRMRYERLLEEIKKMAELSGDAAGSIEREWYRQKLEEIEVLFKERNYMHDRLAFILNRLNNEYKVVRKKISYDYRQLRKREEN